VHCFVPLFSNVLEIAGPAPAAGNSHTVTKRDSTSEKRAESPKQAPAEGDSHKKEKSVLQAKLTKLAIQIGYGGKYRI